MDESRQKILETIKIYAQKNDVPIISDEGLLYLLQLIQKKNVKKILEIGTAIAYSAICMALSDHELIIDTIERNSEMCALAKQNITKLGLNKQINVYYGDALLLDLNLLQANYDLIFIDAAKAQYKKFFIRYSSLLKTKGLIVSDNLLFHGFVNSEEKIYSRNLRQLVKKIKAYNNWLINNTAYKTVFVSVGDGMAVSEKL